MPEKLNLQQCIDTAALRGGKCLSTEYIDNRTQMKWVCEKGHEWNARAGNIRSGKWCPKCKYEKIGELHKKRHKYTIEQLREFAKTKNGKCLSASYIDSQTKIKWQCERGHIWKIKWSNVRNGRWCRECQYINNSLSFADGIDKVYKMAKGRQGRCLSTVYKNEDTKLLFECKDGHQFKTTFAVIKMGCWCPVCIGIKLYKRETYYRKFLETIFKAPFQKCKPHWLNGLELDGYNESLNCCFEYQGEQHFKRHKIFHKTNNDFLKQIQRDETKERIVEAKGIKILYPDYKMSPQKLTNYTYNKLIEWGYLDSPLNYKFIDFVS